MKNILVYFLISFIVLKAQNDPFEANQYMLAENYQQAGNLTKAIEIIEQLFQKNPSNPNYFNKLYNLYLSTKKYETAIRIIELRLSSNTEDANLYGLLGSVYYLMGDIKSAKEKWEIPINKNPQNPFIYRTMANYAIERRAFEIAIEYLIKGKSKSDDPTIFAIDLGELYMITMQYQSAIEQYCELLLKNPAMYSVVETKIFSFIDKPGVLQNAIKIVSSYQTKAIVFKNLLARLFTESKQYSKAFELYKEIEKSQSTGGQQLLNYANFLINENEFQIAKNIFEYTFSIAENQSIKSFAKLGMAKTLEAILWNDFNNNNDVWKKYYLPEHFSASQTISAISAYEEVINLFSYSDVAVEAIYSIGKISFYANNDFQKAENYFNEIVNKYPTSRFYAKSLLELAIINIISNNYSKAKELLKSIEAAISLNDEEKMSAFYYLTKLYSVEGDFQRAYELLKKITTNVKNDFTNDALEFSLLLSVAKNDSLNLTKYAKSEIFIIQKRYKEAQSLFDEILKGQQSLIFTPFCFLMSAEMDIALNQFSSALMKLDNIYYAKEKNIFSDKALYLKARIMEYALNNLTEAIENYQKILIEFPKSIYLDEARQAITRLNQEIIKRKKDA
jgi:tetratricopeptide (TPR) repeat protein